MENRQGQASLAGFAAPLDPTGDASLYGPPPWRFRGRSVTVIAPCDQEALAALLPPPLEPAGDGSVRFTVHDLLCDIGLGMDYAVRHPERCCVREAVVAVAARHNGRAGYYDPFLYCDSDAEIAVGREGYFARDVPAFATFYTMRVLPDSTGGPTVREVFASEMSDVQVHDPWTGSAVLRVHAPELAALEPGDAISARANAIAWTKSVSTLLARTEVTPS